jgi:hypothetical protein
LRIKFPSEANFVNLGWFFSSFSILDHRLNANENIHFHGSHSIKISFDINWLEMSAASIISPLQVKRGASDISTIGK